ncbi:GNAT family N-acetyltransferase [Erysipelothrix enhydrae]|uniref:GNAT family N-acetyltransferase n=1 Tax=Erysipelothrix enhydrae TaxID=2890314 RepID=UPI002B253E20|nr:GNAT family N-acetyltransferase [Erysipelothrix sp. 4322-04]WRB86336.1 GNAT family N-acetyltransferase [Erysipelothrix sp. 4322-04]
MELKLIDISDEFDDNGVETLLFDIYVGEIDRYVGRCEYRNEHGRDLWYYGNIGYIIYPPYRGHNFAYHACVALFDIVKSVKPGLPELIITCNPDNIASKKTILKLGGNYHSTIDIMADHELFKLGETSKEIYTIKL